MQDSRPAHTPESDCGCGNAHPSAVTRRALIGASAGTLAFAPRVGVAQSTPETEQPVATPSGAVTIDLEQLASMSSALVGGGTLSDGAVQTLGELIGGDDGRVAAFEELASMDDPTALDGASSDAQALAEEIVGFWYLGQFDGKPVANRAELFFSLPVWGTLPYITQPTLCKSFGYWAMDVSLD